MHVPKYGADDVKRVPNINLFGRLFSKRRSKARQQKKERRRKKR